MDATPPRGSIRYRRSDWGCDPDGSVTASVAPTSVAEWKYVFDGEVAVFYSNQDSARQVRVRCDGTKLIDARSSHCVIVDGQQAPSAEGIDEFLFSCEGLAINDGADTLVAEVAAGEVLSRSEQEGMCIIRYRARLAPPEQIHQVEWIPGPFPRLSARQFEFPATHQGSVVAGATRVVRAEVTEWEGLGDEALPRVITRTVSDRVLDGRETIKMRSRFEVVERSRTVTAADAATLGEPTIGAGWVVSIPRVNIVVTIGRREFVFQGAVYEAATPVALSDLVRIPELIAASECPSQSSR